MRIKYILPLLFILYIQSIIAQNIKGTVLDDKHKVISYATIRLLNADSTFVQGTHTDSLGNYSMELKQKGYYLLNISSIGYKSQIFPMEVQYAKQLSTIVLKTDNIELKGIIVNGTSFVRKDDQILIYLDNKQKRHSTTGYDVLYRLMIPEIDVDRIEGKVSTIGGEVTLYIDGRKVDSREIRSLNPEEIDKIEYYDVPIGKYMNDVAAINFITKKYKTGGYVSLSGDQRIGYMNGNYSAVVKVSHNNTNYTLFAGHSMNNYDGTTDDTRESFIFTEYTTDRHSGTLKNRVKNSSQYAQLNISNQKDKHSLIGKLSLVHNDAPNNCTQNILDYGNNEKKQRSSRETNQSGWKPGIELYGYFDLNDRQFLEITLTGNCSYNTYTYTYQEHKFSTSTNSKEDLYDLLAILNYGIRFRHQNSLNIQAYHFRTISSIDYKGNNSSWQHFWEGESLLFLEYNQKFGKKLSLRIAPGLSYIQYSLHRSERQEKYSPRLRFNLMYYPSNNQQIRLGFPVGNGSLEISQLNEVEQQIDSLQIRRGNPNQKIAFQTTPMVAYNGQFGKFNIGANISYNIINHAQTEDIYIENDKLIRSNQSEGKYRRFSVQLSGSWKVTDDLRIKLDGGWQYVRYPSTSEKLKSLSGSMQVDYYWDDFSCGIFAKSRTKWLNLNLMYGIEPAKYGAYISWNHNNWHIESGVMNPFTKNYEQKTWMNRSVYTYKNVATSKLYQPNGYVKVAYIFSFGKKTSRDHNDIDTNINSAILKVN